MTTLEFKIDGKSHICQVFKPEHIHGPTAAVLVYPDWSGCSENSFHYARELTDCGYIAIAVDVYGEAKVGSSAEENAALMTPLKEDRAKLLTITQAAVEAAKSHPDVDNDNIAAIGFCFGGLAVLDLARAGTELKAVCSFHGDLSPTQAIAQTTPVANILIQHGDLDPMVSFEDVTNVRNELNQAGANWEFVIYSGAYHAFMNHGVDDVEMGIQYNEDVAFKAWDKLQLFLLDNLSVDAGHECDEHCDH